MLIGAVLAVVLVLCVGGGITAWLLVRGMDDGKGAADPAAAVTGFLRAVYADRNAEQAANQVCSAARDDSAIRKKIAEVRSYESKYASPRFSWDIPKVTSKDEEKATVAVTLTMTTADEKTAQQKLTFTVVQKTGWWVCDVA